MRDDLLLIKTVNPELIGYITHNPHNLDETEQENKGFRWATSTHFPPDSRIITLQNRYLFEFKAKTNLAPDSPFNGVINLMVRSFNK